MADYDHIAGHWLKNIPYIYLQGDDIKNSFRYYLVDDNAPVYNLENKKGKYEKLSEHKFLFLVPSTCGWISKYFSVLTPTLLQSKTLNLDPNLIRIEGRSQKANLPSEQEMGDISLIREILSASNVNDVKNDIVISRKSIDAGLKKVKTLDFSILSQLYEKIKTVKGKTKKAYLERLFSIYDGDCETLLRLMLPQLDKRLYHIKESTMARLYIDLLSIPESSQKSQELLNWKETQEGAKKYLEFAEVIFDTISYYLESERNENPLTIENINDKLNLLSKAGSLEEQKDILRPLIRKLSALEHKTLIKIILKRGMPTKLVLNVFNKDALDVYNSSFSLAKVCAVAKEGEVFNIIEIFTPIVPMLASRQHPNKINFDDMTSPLVLPELKSKGLSKKKNCLIFETKFDGERIQVHKQGNKVMLFSRKGNNVSSTYSTIIPYILSNVKGDSVILDGEILVWDTEANAFEAFGTNKTYAKENAIKAINKTTIPTKHLAIMFFDIIYYDKPILSMPFIERRDLLEKVIPKQIKGRIELAEQKDICDIETLYKVLDETIEKREEGIILKKPDSFYYAGERAKEWIKIKPSYLEGIGDTFDVLVVGAYYGTKFGQELTKFVCAIIDKEHKTKGEYNYLTFVRVGSGFNESQLKLLNEILNDKVFKYDETKIPANIKFGKDKPDVVIKPKDSIIMELTGVQMTKSDKYTAGYTLRFPVFIKIRYDKDYKDITSMKELLEFDEQFGGFNVRKFRKNSPKKAVSSKEDVKYKVLPHNQPADISDVLLKSNILKGLQICVMSGDKKNSKQDLERLIYADGGDFTQNPIEKKTYVIISGKKTLRTKNHKNYFEIVKPKWLLDSDKQQKLLPLDKYNLY